MHFYAAECFPLIIQKCEFFQWRNETYFSKGIKKIGIEEYEDLCNATILEEMDYMKIGWHRYNN